MWLDEAGRNRGFKGYWSSKNETFFLQWPNYYTYSQVCEWKNNSGARCCTGRINDSPTEFSSPFGDKDTTHFPFPRETAGPFAYGTKAKRGHYWICGHTAYKRLPAEWAGTCYVGIIRPMFFLLPETGGPRLGIRLYGDLGGRRIARKTQSIQVNLGGTQKWASDEWPPERIIQHYRPTTWNANEPISGAREPIYNLNRIIQLQAVLETITNKTADALDLLIRQSQQMSTAVLQHRMVLDYLLAEGGGCVETKYF